MKSIKSLLVLSVLLVAGAVHAQILGTNGFFGTLQTWVTTNDQTNTCFLTNDVLELSSGVVNNNNQNMEAYMDIRVNPYKGLAVGSRLYNNSVLGSIVGEGGYVGWAIVDHSIRFTPELELGYNNSIKTGYVSPGFMAEKAMTQNTFTQLGLFLPFDFKGPQNLTPQVDIALGFKW